jgi:hypothetical protein
MNRQKVLVVLFLAQILAALAGAWEELPPQ